MNYAARAGRVEPADDRDAGVEAALRPAFAAMPNRRYYLCGNKEYASASVTVTLEPGRALDEGQISAMNASGFQRCRRFAAEETSLWSINPVICSRNQYQRSHDLNDAQLRICNDVESRIQRRIRSHSVAYRRER
ncbi:hypothetical protein KCP75_05275 [Salmonella enterica subsp. enterica]|nr:hypothetical protein KCP75_05275 [Salmonella enterica subsp. enterica]